MFLKLFFLLERAWVSFVPSDWDGCFHPRPESDSHQNPPWGSAWVCLSRSKYTHTHTRARTHTFTWAGRSFLGLLLGGKKRRGREERDLFRHGQIFYCHEKKNPPFNASMSFPMCDCSDILKHQQGKKSVNLGRNTSFKLAVTDTAHTDWNTHFCMGTVGGIYRVLVCVWQIASWPVLYLNPRDGFQHVKGRAQPRVIKTMVLYFTADEYVKVKIIFSTRAIKFNKYASFQIVHRFNYFVRYSHKQEWRTACINCQESQAAVIVERCAVSYQYVITECVWQRRVCV